MRGRVFRRKLTENTTLNLSELSAGCGVYHFSIKNVGTTYVLINDGTGEYIEPGETFIIESELGIVNEAFSLQFFPEDEVDYIVNSPDYQAKDSQAINGAIISYIVPVECS